jgi:flagellar motor protein MotB
LDPWYKVAIPRKELRDGRSLDPSEFAVHLDQIINGTAPEDYKDPEGFFKRTYFSSALASLCILVLRRLSGQTANTAPVLSLVTQFGGGKTHTLATLYHLAQNGQKALEYEGVPNLLKDTELNTIPKARVACFVGNAWDAEPGLETPWLDIAWQLAGEAGRRLLGDAARTNAPGTAILQKLFSLVNEPILILFDETLNYIGRYPQQAEQFYSFVQNLTSALTGTERAIGVLSLPASPTEMTVILYEWQMKLIKVVGRVGKPLLANDPEEISEIIRRRLFEDIGRKSMQQAVARQFAQWIFSRRDRLPAEFANFPEEAIRSRIEACYPFHPSTLTVFQRKWQSLPTFQQTRGTLAMLGLWISQAYREGYRRVWREPLITLASAPLYDLDFRSKILEQLGEMRLEAALEYDIAGNNSHAVALDKEFSDGLGKTRLHQRVATALFFESCGGMVSDKAATLPELRMALGDPETETTLVDAAVQNLVARCYYLRSIGTGSWRFGYAPTMRKVHADRKAALDPDEVQHQMFEIVRQIFRDKQELNLNFFPKAPDAVADHPLLTLIIMPPDLELNMVALGQLTDWTINNGQTPRQYPGGILWLVPEAGFGLRSSIEDWLAWQSTKRDADRGLLGDLESSDQQMMQDELKRAKDIVEENVWSLYNRLLLWNGREGKLLEVPLRQMHSSEARTITGAILARLRQESVLNKEIGASYIERYWPPALKESGVWPLLGLRAAFFQGYLTRLEKADDALRQMIYRAVRQGMFGLGVGKNAEQLDRIWFQEDVDPAEIAFNNETFLLLPARVEIIRAGATAPKVLPDTVQEVPGVGLPQAGGEKPTQPGQAPDVQAAGIPAQPVTIEWRGSLPKDKWNLFSHRVLARLGSAEPITINVTIQTTVKEPSVKQQLNNALQELGLLGEFQNVHPNIPEKE